VAEAKLWRGDRIGRIYGVMFCICKQNGVREVAVGFEEQRPCAWLYEGF